ncbi:flagellar biosynthetic protein FliO [Pseudodesulfovibrio tunisiensis]|uniref:flagellar biosynthetic protein FliO n=1 Tax=Pseudodesulfovibrio tunisiensis TaxID=463192 RepID=UPI001FB457AE|nr:flagellar biosynthetic protein FliO [Pseudodesulfovibrio tunisiensis]
MGFAAEHAAKAMELPAVDTGSTILTMAGYLCLLLALLFAVYYMLRRYGPKGLGSARNGAGPHLLGRLMLGNRQSVAVVRYRDRELVLGVTEQNISLLAETEAGDEPPESGPNFASVLKRNRDDDGKDSK